MISHSKMRVLDLFSGIGGFSLGLERTGGFETVAFCEICPKARKVLSKHWPNVKQYDDIKELSNEQLIADGIEADVITGGFPCQDISCAGKGKGIKAERSGLWSEMFRLIRDVRPTWAIVENVSALRSKGLALVLQNLSSIRYVCEWHCIPASAVGAPHQRDRIWIIANRDTDRINEQKVGEVQGGQDSKPCGICGDVAHPKCNGFSATTLTRSIEETVRQESTRESNALDSQGTGSLSTTKANVANPNSERLQGHSEGLEESCEVRTQETPRLLSSIPRADFWAVEPNVGRVAHGIPKRVDRLKQLGNSVVPQIPELIGNAILEVEG